MQSLLRTTTSKKLVSCIPTAQSSRSFASAVLKDPFTINIKKDQVGEAPVIVKTTSKASNGITLATVDTAAPQSGVAVVLKAGSRFESLDAPGVAHLLKTSTLRNTPSRSAFRTVREAELSGSSLETSLSREHLTVSSQFLRDSLPNTLPALLTHTLTSFYNAYEFLDAQELVAAETKANLADPFTVLMNQLHRVAYRSGLGNSLFASSTQLESLTRADVDAFLKRVLENVADNVAIVGYGVAHSDLEAVVESTLKSLSLPAQSAAKSATPTATKYFGGQSHMTLSSTDSHHVAVGFNTNAAYTSTNNVAASLVLKSLLNNTTPSSVSTFSASYSDAGLVGFYTESSCSTSLKTAVQSSLDALKKLSETKTVSAAALESAKKHAVVTLESNPMTANIDTLSRTPTTSVADLVKAVQKVSAGDVTKLVKDVVLKSKPALVGGTSGNVGVLPFLEDLKI